MDKAGRQLHQHLCTLSLESSDLWTFAGDTGDDGDLVVYGPAQQPLLTDHIVSYWRS